MNASDQPLIRDEQAADFEAIRDVTFQAFAECDLGYNDEADLIDRVRQSCPSFVSLVAESDDHIVGHLLLSPAKLGRLEGMGLAPMSVLPEYQGKGIGTQLVMTALARARAIPVPFVIVLGHPAYYSRFGFRPAIEQQIHCEIADLPDKLFRIIQLDASQDLPSGVARYCPAIWGNENT